MYLESENKKNTQMHKVLFYPNENTGRIRNPVVSASKGQSNQNNDNLCKEVDQGLVVKTIGRIRSRIVVLLTSQPCLLTQEQITW